MVGFRLAFALTAGSAALLGACASTPDQSRSERDRLIFEDPYANEWVARSRVDPDSQNPANVVCNGDRCFVANSHGEFIPMSREERRNWRKGIRLAEQQRRFNEGFETPPGPPEQFEPNPPGPEPRPDNQPD